MSMSSIDVSLIASTHQPQSTRTRPILRPHRPPPPPPLSSIQLNLPGSPIEEIVIHTPFANAPREAEDIGNKDDNQLSIISKFETLFCNFNYETIREKILDRNLIECNFTTVLWRIFLNCLSHNTVEWDDLIDKSRDNYEKLVERFDIDPNKMNFDFEDQQFLNHPLSLDENSLWTQYFADKELKQTIIIDVERTYPDIAFFRDPHIISLQLRILFTHTRYHSTIPYRQGMHEILGIVVHLIHSESLNVREFDESNALMKKLYDQKYLEHDAYAIFEKIMDHLAQFYSITKSNSPNDKNVILNHTKRKPFQPLDGMEISTNGAAMRMNSLLNRLRCYDKVLYDKLQLLNVEPTVYGTRWLRLLFGREVPFESIPNLWTVIFCYDEQFGFVDYFFIALLLQIGQIIHKQQEKECCNYLQYLMKQNSITNVEPVIRTALQLTGRNIPTLYEQQTTLPPTRTDQEHSNPSELNRENLVRQEKLQRIKISSSSNPRLHRPHLFEMQNSASISQRQKLGDTMKRSQSNTVEFGSSPPTSKQIEPHIDDDPKGDLWNGNITRQKFEENIKLQRNCAQFMSKFIDRLQQQICDLEVSNEDELLIQISGLKQISNILDGKLTFDKDSLEILANYACKSKTTQMDNNSADSPS